MWVADIQQETRPDRHAPRLYVLAKFIQSLDVFGQNAETRLFRGESEVAEFTIAVWVFIIDLLAALV